MTENKIFNKEKRKQKNSKTLTKRIVISTKHKLKSKKHKEGRKSGVLKKSTHKDVKQMLTNTCPVQSFYPTPANLVKSRSYIKKGIHPSICQGGI